MDISKFRLEKHEQTINPQRELIIQKRNVVSHKWVMTMMHVSHAITEQRQFRTDLLFMKKSANDTNEPLPSYHLNSTEPSAIFARKRSILRQALFVMVAYVRRDQSVTTGKFRVVIDCEYAEDLSALLVDIFDVEICHGPITRPDLYITGTMNLAEIDRVGARFTLARIDLGTGLAIDAPPGLLMYPAFSHSEDPYMFMFLQSPLQATKIYSLSLIKQTFDRALIERERAVYENPLNNLYVPIIGPSGEWTCNFNTMHAFTTMVLYCNRKGKSYDLHFFERILIL